MPESDFKYTSLRIQKKTNSLLEQIREVDGCSMNSLCCAMLDKYARVLMQDRNLSNKEDRKTLQRDVQQLLTEVQEIDNSTTTSNI